MTGKAPALRSRLFLSKNRTFRSALATRYHAIVILDQAGWHGAKELKIPHNISLMPLPPRSPELNSQENIWQFMRQIGCQTASSNPMTNRRSLLLRLEHSHRSAVEDHVNRAPRLGLDRSINLRIGIRCVCDATNANNRRQRVAAVIGFIQIRSDGDRPHKSRRVGR